VSRNFSHRIVIVFAALLCVMNSGRATTNDFFAHGIELSHAGQFPEAAAAFEKSASIQPAAGTLVNLGLAEWQRGHAGAAILAWEQARWIDPFDSRAKTNLDFARQAAQVDEPQLKWFETVSTWLPPNAWVWLAGTTFWLAVGLLLLPGIFWRRKATWQQWLAALSFGVFLFSLTADFGVVSRTEIGFVVKKNAQLQLTPTHNGEIISTLAAGEPARKLRTRGDYVFIRTQGAAGWLEQDEFGLICPANSRSR
jgi:tetratricopeptide (TPR) repeat protein